MSAWDLNSSGETGDKQINNYYEAMRRNEAGSRGESEEGNCFMRIGRKGPPEEVTLEQLEKT